MNEMSQEKGIFIICDDDGFIKNIHRNDFDLKKEDLINKPFVHLFLTEHITKALDFLYKIRINSAVFGYELNLIINENICTLNFGGGKIENLIYIIGTINKFEFEKFISEALQISNEQTNIIRTLAKEKYKSLGLQNRADSFLFDELSKLNNELVKMQRELTKKNLELESLNKLKNEFLGMAAHDLRNPLNILLNFSSFLLDEKENLSKDQIHLIEVIYSQSLFMVKLVTDLLDISSIESGKLSLELSVVDFIPLLESSINYHKILNNKKHISIFYSHKEPSIELKIDKNKIEQVLNNLISNAFKYSYPNTSILVTVEKRTDDILFGIKDEGQGIAKEELSKLFRPFQKMSSKPTAGEKSTGLGLAIVKRIIEGHRGKIWVESEVGKGSIFYFTLPTS